MDRAAIYEQRHAYEEKWKEGFSVRLKGLVESRGISDEFLMETLECDAARAAELLEGRDYPTVVELLRLCYLCYDADTYLFETRKYALAYMIRGSIL